MQVKYRKSGQAPERIYIVIARGCTLPDRWYLGDDSRARLHARAPIITTETCYQGMCRLSLSLAWRISL